MSLLFDLGPESVADTSNDHYTPPWIFDAAGLVFDMDVAAPVDPARRTCPARRYLTPLEDGLTQPWEGLVWMNPPWSASRPWVDKFISHEGGLALLPATRSRATQLVLAASCALALFTGQFIRPNGDTDHNPWLVMLVARGEVARQALERVARARNVPAWYGALRACP